MENNNSKDTNPSELKRVETKNMSPLDKIKSQCDSILFGDSSYWVEMNESYFKSLRDQYNKSSDEIGPRKFKSYINSDMPIYVMVIPAGKQHDGSKMIQYFHVIVEDFELGQCNGSYDLVTDVDLLSKFGIEYGEV